MNLVGWGRYPRVKSTSFTFKGNSMLERIVTHNNEIIAYGNGRSYGDSALSKNVIRTRSHNYFLNFNDSNGMLHVQAGVLLSEILETFVPKGWFLKVTPGTKFITVGGAIASDIHGKNHHKYGCFSESVEMISIMLPNGEIVRCNNKENSTLFKATCGGMGLTGIIVDAEISLMKIKSQYLDQITIKTKNLKETFEAFERYKEAK